MTVDKFCELPNADQFSRALQSLWHDARGDWEKAHELAQNGAGLDGDWVHAYLHRKEGDEANARYWYSRAGRRKPALSLTEEWSAITTELLKATPPDRT